MLACLRFASGKGWGVLFCPYLHFARCCVKLRAGGEIAGGIANMLFMLMCDSSSGSGADRVAYGWG